MQGQSGSLIALIFSGLAVAFYGSDHEINLQNVLMGSASLVSIAAITLPRLRYRQPDTTSQPEETRRIKHV